MGNFSVIHRVVVLIAVALMFGAKKLRNAGEDLGGAVHDLKKSSNEGTEGQSAKKDEVIEHKKDEEDKA